MYDKIIEIAETKGTLMENTENIVELTVDNFRELIAETSQEKLVVVGFWVQGDETSSKQITALKSIISSYPQHAVLATCDCSEDQRIAMQFGVQSIPAVVLVQNAKPVDGFVGDMTEEQLKEKLAPHLPSVEQQLMQQARELLEQQNINEAYQLALQAFQAANENVDAKLLLADLSIELGKLEDAEQLINSIGLADQHGDYQRLVSKLELAKQASDSPELSNLEELVGQNPEDFDLRIQFAIKLHEARRNEEALEHLFVILKKDLAFENAKQRYLDIINDLPKGDPLAGRYRSKLFSMMY